MKKATWTTVAVLLVSIAMNVWQCIHQPQPHTDVRTDTVWQDTTIYTPTAAETISTEKVLFVTVPVTAWDTVHDSVRISLPVEQRRYDDSIYTAWVSGYEPRLDSITVRQRTITTTITETIVKQSPRLSLGIQCGAGIGTISRKPDIYVGVGAQWRMWPR